MLIRSGVWNEDTYEELVRQLGLGQDFPYGEFKAYVKGLLGESQIPCINPVLPEHSQN